MTGFDPEDDDLNEKLFARLKEQGDYVELRVLPDGSIAGLLDLIYTRAICLGINAYGYERRFCFSDRRLATERFKQLRSEEDEPQGYIARR